jgi:hypothetical protein
MQIVINRNESYIPFNMAVEKPNAGVVRYIAEYNVSRWLDKNCIPTHRSLGESDIVGVDTSVFVGSSNKLKVVAMQMERMLSRIEIVDNDLNNLILLQNVRVCIDSVDSWVRGVVAGSHDSVKGWNHRCHVGNTVEEGTAES